MKPAMSEEAKRIEGLWDRSRIIDPDGDCRILPGQCERSSLDPRTRRRPPLEREIDRMNAPCILREVAEGDFEVRVRVKGIGSPGSRASTTRYAPYHGAGILLWKDPGNYVRLEIAADRRKSEYTIRTPISSCRRTAAWPPPGASRSRTARATSRQFFHQHIPRCRVDDSRPHPGFLHVV